MAVTQLIRRGLGALQRLINRGLGRGDELAPPKSAAKAVARKDDTGSHGGAYTGIITGVRCAETVDTNGRATARDGCEYDCPKPGHGVNFVIASSRLTKVEGEWVVRLEDVTDCGAVIDSASDDVFSG